MTKSHPSRRLGRAVRAALLATSLLVATPAMAQLTTATIRGQVTTSGAAAPGAAVMAVNSENGSTVRATAGPDGSYVLSGLRTGPYTITITPAGGTAVARQVVVSVGQTTTLDIDTATNTAGAADDPGLADTGVATGTEAGTIVVVGQRLVEMRTSEVGTNVTDDQIANLPQGSRNFLNFAALAPGVRILQSGELRQSFGGGGVGDPEGESFGGPQVNVFIDGVSLKSNIQQGGIVGQDVSAGNPFSQLAVREFRVLTSNFKAEYEDAGTAIITAVTKSGTNRFAVDAFTLYQDQSLTSRNYLQRDLDEVPKRKRLQYGASLGGPIVQDNLFFFASYEANIQDRIYDVVPGTIPAGQAGFIPFDVDEFRGSFAGPFREHLGFGKLTWQVADNQLVELSASARIENDIRDFGGQNSRERGASVENDVYTVKLRYDYLGAGWLNEASIDFLKSDLAFGADQEAGFGLQYGGVINVGGRSGFEEVGQQGLTFRNNFSLTDVEWMGSHLLKVGGKVSFQRYRLGGTGFRDNPNFIFTFDSSRNLNFSFPELVLFGSGNPDLSARTTQFGLFVQDDWEVNEHLLLNLGLRWDYDSNANNNDFVTPARAVEALRALAADPRTPDFFDVEDYISTGDNRGAGAGNFAPRLGFSYDVNANQRTVLFGGYARNYDRALFRNAAEETLLSQYTEGELFFSPNGGLFNGRQTIAFQPQYLTEEGFAQLLANLDPATGFGQLRIIPNDLKTPYTDQLSLGIRQRLGPVRASLTLNRTIGKNQIAYAPLNRSQTFLPNGEYEYIPMINGYGNAIAAFNTRQTRYHAVFATLDKPYTEATGWGFGVAYTFAKSKERGAGGGGGFNFDYPNIADQPFEPNAGDERHRAVLNGIVDLPFDVRLSGLVTWSSGLPYRVFDATRGFRRQGRELRVGHFLHTPDFFQVDLRLQKMFQVMGGEFALSAEVFNLFNRANFAGGDNFFAPGSTLEFRNPNSLSGPSRSVQFGVSTRF